MTILNRIEIKDTMHQRLNPQATISLDTRESGAISDYGFASQKQYQMRLQVGCEFWANKAQYDTARKNAEKVLLHTLYGDILARLDSAVHAIYNRDEKAAIDHIYSIRNELVK